MLDKLRENKSSFLINFVVGLIVVVFIFWGSSSSSGGKTSIVARVNGAAITDIEYGRAVANRLEQTRRLSSRSPSPAEEALVRQQVLDQLIELELLKQEAKRLSIVVSDYELKQAILENPYLKDDSGNFDARRYKRIVKRYPAFESDERERLLIDKLEEAVRQTVHVSEADLREMYERQNTKVNLEYVRIPYSRFAKDIQITQEERDAFIKDHAAELQARYDADFKRLYDLPKKVQARHILLKIDENDPPELKELTRGKMKQIQELTKSRDFAELAREFSEDPGSTAKGGDLGLFDEKRMEEAFSKVAFSTPKGAISDIVETRYGLHLIKVEEIQEAQVKKLADVQNQIADTLIQEQKGPELARKAAEKLQAAWVKGGPELEAALKESALEVQESGLTTRAGDTIRGIGRSPELAGAAFNLRPGSPAPDKLFTVGESFVLVRLKERQEADPTGFAAQRDKLVNQALREKQQKVLEAWKQSLKANADIDSEIPLAAAAS